MAAQSFIHVITMHGIGMCICIFTGFYWQQLFLDKFCHT